MDTRYDSPEIEEQRKARRKQQQQSFRRNQAFGLLFAASAVLVYRLLHTPSAWLFPAGWWRLW